MFERLRERFEQNNLTPQEMALRRRSAHRQRIRDGSTPVILTNYEKRAILRRKQEEARDKNKLDKAFLDAMKKGR